MRFRTLILVILIPVSAWTEAKTVSDFFALSKKMRSELVDEKFKDKKILKLKVYEKQLLEAQKEYEIKNPKKGDDIEKKVNFLYYTFEPLFTAKSFDTLECKKTEHQVLLEDSMGKEEDAPLSPDAKEALEWLHLICK